MKTIKIPYIYDTDKSHKIIQVKDNKYYFQPAEKWMPIYYTYNEDNSAILAFDCDGMGSMLWVGSEIEGMKISKIIFDDKLYIYFE